MYATQIAMVEEEISNTHSRMMAEKEKY